MRGIATVSLLGLALVAAPLTLRLPTAVAALACIALCVLVAVVACEARDALTTAAGALAALAWNLLATDAPVLAGAALVALVLAPRSMRARSSRARALHGVATLGVGLAAAWVAVRYGGADSVAVRAAAVLVAGLAASVTLLAPVDDPVTWSLASLSRELTGATSDRLLRAASLRRGAYDSPAMEALGDATASRIELAWRALAEIAAQRVTAASARGTPVLDQRIEQHVEALERIHAAVEERYARAAGLVDPRLAAARVDGETLETEVRALIEVNPG